MSAVLFNFAGIGSEGSGKYRLQKIGLCLKLRHILKTYQGQYYGEKKANAQRTKATAAAFGIKVRRRCDGTAAGNVRLPFKKVLWCRKSIYMPEQRKVGIDRLVFIIRTCLVNVDVAELLYKLMLKQ